MREDDHDAGSDPYGRHGGAIEVLIDKRILKMLNSDAGEGCWS